MYHTIDKNSTNQFLDFVESISVFNVFGFTFHISRFTLIIVAILLKCGRYWCHQHSIEAFFLVYCWQMEFRYKYSLSSHHFVQSHSHNNNAIGDGVMADGWNWRWCRFSRRRCYYCCNCLKSCKYNRYIRIYIYLDISWIEFAMN